MCTLMAWDDRAKALLAFASPGSAGREAASAFKCRCMFDGRGGCSAKHCPWVARHGRVGGGTSSVRFVSPSEGPHTTSRLHGSWE